jgi:hypothetical protein
VWFLPALILLTVPRSVGIVLWYQELFPQQSALSSALIAQVLYAPTETRPLVTELSAETVGVESPPPVGADVVPPLVASILVCSSSKTPQPTTSNAAAMMASKVFITVPLFAGLDYLVDVYMWNKV